MIRTRGWGLVDSAPSPCSSFSSFASPLPAGSQRRRRSLVVSSPKSPASWSLLLPPPPLPPSSRWQTESPQPLNMHTHAPARSLGAGSGRSSPPTRPASRLGRLADWPTEGGKVGASSERARAIIARDSRARLPKSRKRAGDPSHTRSGLKWAG